MELYDEDFIKEKKDKGKKGSRIILVMIFLLIILCIVIIGLIYMLKSSIVHNIIDGKENDKLGNIIQYTEDGNLIIPIRKFADIINYQNHSGDYTNKSEDVTKCYIETQNEVTNISANSKYILVKDKNKNNNYTKVELEKPIDLINGELCTNIEAIKKIFNLEFYYDTKTKGITVYTLQHLVKYYTAQLEKNGYVELKEGFENEKSILNNMLVVKNNEEKYAVVDLNNKWTPILEAKYDDIEYLSYKKQFLVTSSDKKGIISANKENIIDIVYEDIITMNDNLYEVKKDGKVGVVNKLGKTIIYPGNDYIGIENNKFSKLQEQDDYILLNDLIPVKKGNKWGIFNINGETILDFNYDGLGCIINDSKNSDRESVLYIDGYDIFIMQVDKKYVLLDKTGKNITSIKNQNVNLVFDLIYGIDNDGVLDYYLIYNEEIIKVIDLLENLGVKKVNNE